MNIRHIAAISLTCMALYGAVMAKGNVTATDNVTDANNDCFKVVTPVATYFFDKVGAGFTSILDKANNDWVGYKDDNNSGANGYYRGIPNLGDCCHPGFPSKWGEGPTDMKTTLEKDEDDYVALFSEGNKGGVWKTRWEFYPTHATLTVLSVAKNYWALYEGTPGGSFNKSEDYYVWSDGSMHAGSETNVGKDLPDPEWVYFGDSKMSRALLYVHHDNDNIKDTYWEMGAMTVFGFARTCQGECFGFAPATTPKQFTIALIEDSTFSGMKAFAEKILAGDVVAGKRPSAYARCSMAQSDHVRMYDIRGRLTARDGGSMRLLTAPAGVYIASDRSHRKTVAVFQEGIQK